jgi:ABC-type multidrug transport system ATPase subunit
MEEADALSDRIIILSNGKICANDRTNELKVIYGTGYKLILNTFNKENNFEILKIIEKFLLNCQIESETNDQLIIQTNEESSSLFIQLLNQLEILKENHLILNYGLTNTTLGQLIFHLK